MEDQINHLQKILITTRPLQDNFKKEMLSCKSPFSSLRKIGQFYAEIVVACKSVGSVVEWLTYRTNDQHGLGSKPSCAILLCSWEKHFTTLSPAWWS